MEPLFGLIAVAVAASVAFLVRSERRRSQLTAWRRAAEGVGLTDVESTEGGLFQGAALWGRSGQLRVRLESYRRGKYVHGTRIVIDGLGHGAGGLTLRREGLSTAFEKRFAGEREIEVGDPAFDAEYYVQGSAPLALAILDPETRGQAAVLLRGHVPVEGGRRVEVDASLSYGRLVVEVKESGFSRNRERVPEILSSVLEVARRLVAPEDVPARLAANLAAEPEPAVRLASLLALAREFPRHPATRAALLASRGDASEEVRLRAAMALGEEGRGTLLALVGDTRMADAVAARAVTALGPDLPVSLAEAALRQALAEPGRPQTAMACLSGLARLGHGEAEGLLIEALRSGDPQVTLEAARALGRVGTVSAVSALHEAMAPRGDLVRSAGRQAIAEIQARLTGAAPGQLTLAGGEAGALSLADGEPGRLSLAEGEDEARKPTASRQTE